MELQDLVDSDSDDDSDDEDNNENGENNTTGNLIDNQMNIDEKETVEYDDTEENINVDTTATNQGADGCINNNNRESEATVENTERGYQEKILETQVEPEPRISSRSGFRNILNPVGSHRNRYERKFQNNTTENLSKKVNLCTLGSKKTKSRKTRSDMATNRWVNNKKGRT